MLTIEPPFYPFRNAIVFRDHTDPDQFYLLSGIPKVSGFSLVKYRSDPTDDPSRTRAAGSAIVEVMIPTGDVAQLQSEVAAQSGRANARLEPVVFTNGSARVLFARVPDDHRVEDLVGTTMVSPVSPHAAAFALTLGAEGTALLARAAAGEQVPAGVAYELRFPALTPALHARVTLDYERIYDRLAASAAFPQYTQAQIDVELAALIDRAAIRIEMTGVPDAANPRGEPTLVMDLVKARLQSDFFRAGISSQPEEGIAGALPRLLADLLGSEIPSASALFALKPRVDAIGEQKTFELTYDGPAAVELTHVCTAGLALPADGSVTPIVSEIDLSHPFLSTLDLRVSPAIDFEEFADLKRVVVNLVHGETRQSLLFTKDASASQDIHMRLANPRDDEYQYDVEYDFGIDSADGPAVIKAGPYRSRDRVLAIDPRAHMQYRRVQVELGPVDLAITPRLMVHLRAQVEPGQLDLARRTVVLDKEHQSGTGRWRRPIASSTLWVFARVEFFDATGSIGQGDEIEVIGDTFVALGPPLLEVSVVPVVDWTDIEGVIVHVRYEDGDYVSAHELMFSAQAAAPASLQIPILHGERRAYRWRQTVLHKNGSIAETTLAVADAPVLLVGFEKPSTHKVDVHVVGPSGPGMIVRVDFVVTTSSGEQKQNIVLMGPENKKTIALPFDADGGNRYRYEARLLTSAGETLLSSGEYDTEVLVLTTVA